MDGQRKCKCKSYIAILISNLLLMGCGQGDVNIGAVEIPICTLDTDDMFSNRDGEADYDEGTAAIITLNGSSASCASDAVEISGSTVTITDEGTFILSGSLDNGKVVVNAEKADKLKLVLKNVDITCENSAALYIRQADKVFVTLAQDSENTLKTTGEFTSIDENKIDAVLFSKEDLTLNGSGSLKLECAKEQGIVSRDALVFAGGNYTIDAGKHGISGKDSVRIAEGNFQIRAGKDGIHAENEDDMSLGFVYIAGGDISIAASDEGIMAGNQVLIEGGKIMVTESKEGIEGLTVDIAGGDVTVNSVDDGINASDGTSSKVTENAYIKISGGIVKVSASGDGVDSNGGLFVTGGETYVFGPENSANGSVDFSGVGQITGGVFVAAGVSGMTQNFGNGSTQGSMIVNLEAMQNAGTDITVQDENGKELISCRSEKKFNCVLISCPDLQVGNCYTLTVGDTRTSI